MIASLNPSRWRRSVAGVEDVAQFAREGLGLASVAEITAEEATVVAREHGGLLPEQFGGGHRCASGEGAQGLLAHGDYDAGRCRGERGDVGAVAADRP